MLKKLGIIVGAVLLLCIVTMILIMTFVSPNRLKPILTAQVAKHTGRELVIDGDLSWTFFPRLSIKTGHMTLSNPPGFKQHFLADIQEADISVNVLPLLRNKIQSSGIVLHGLTLNLIKNAEGQVNWVFTSKESSSEETGTSSASSETSVALKSLAIAGIDVSNGQINWLDEQAKKAVSLDHVEWHAKEISFVEPFPMTASFTLTSQQPALTAVIGIKGNIALNMTKQFVAFRSLNLTADIQQDRQRYPIEITGDLSADLLAQTLQWSDLRLKSRDLVLSGKLNIAELMSQPIMTGQLRLAPFDLRAWLKACGQDIANIQAFQSVKGDIRLSAVNHVTTIQGKLSVDTMEINHIKLSQVSIPLQWQKNTVTLAPVNANFYQGNLQANAVANLSGVNPSVSLNAKLVNIQAGDLLRDLSAEKKKITFSGLANATVDLRTVGLDQVSGVKNLNGRAQFSVANGTLEGIDIRYYINVAKSLLAQKAPTATNTNKTEFASMTGTAIIQNGTVQNNDLLVTSSLFTTRGNGNIDLVNQQIHYQLNTLINKTGAMEDAGLVDLSTINLPISITGSLQDPSIKMDTSALTKAVANTVIQKTKEDLKNKLQKQIGGSGGALLQNLLGH